MTQQKTTEQLLLDIFVELNSRPSHAKSTVKKKVLILSTPRSGSSMFCEILNNSKLLGECREWFNIRYLNAYAQLTQNPNIDFQKYLDFVVEKTIGETGVFAVNMHIEQHHELQKYNLNVFDLKFDHIIYIERKNKVEQAISLTKASLSDQWTSDAQSKDYDESRLNEVAITQSLLHLVKSDFEYKQNLANDDDIICAYEDFSGPDQQNYFKGIFEQLGFANPIINTQTELKKQRNQSSNDLSDRYKQYLIGH